MRAIPRAQKVLLDTLLTAHPRAATHDFIQETLWPIDADEPPDPSLTVRVYVNRLRSRLGYDAITCVWRTGYRIEAHAIEAARKLSAERAALDVEAG